MNGFAEALKCVFLGLIVLAPFAVGYATGKAGGTGSWIIFGLCAVPLVGFAFVAEGMRESTSSSGLNAYWGFLPILSLISGRFTGGYAA